MNVQTKRDPSTFVQLDIFNFSEEERKETIKSAVTEVHPMQLVAGDIVEFVSYSGKIVTGTYVTRGFWDGRDRECPQFYYFCVNGTYLEMNPKVCAWSLIRHDDAFEKPAKDDITEC